MTLTLVRHDKVLMQIINHDKIQQSGKKDQQKQRYNIISFHLLLDVH